MQYGWTPLYIAAQNGHVEVVKALLGAGMNSKTADKVCLRQEDARLRRERGVRWSHDRVHGMRTQLGRR